ncbi:MAG: DMT family transporter [Firmicutes bacterium]|nr:DMT family transporter [Bacillota bacterium]
MQLTTITNAVLPYNIQPVMIALLAPFILKEKLERGLIPVLLLSLLGLLILVFPTLSEYSRSDLAGIGLALAGTFFLSVITLITRLLKADAATFVYYEMFIAVFCLLPFLKPSRLLDWRALVMAAVIGLVHTALGYILYYDGLGETKMQYAATLTYITPVTAVLTGYLFFREEISPYAIIGGVLIMANSIMVTLKK